MPTPRAAAAALPLLALLAVVLPAPGAAAAPREARLEPAPSRIAYVGTDARGSWRGEAPLAELALRLDPADLRRSELVAVVETAAFASGNLIRDVNGRRTVFESRAHPRAAFRLERVEAAAPDLPDGAAREVVLVGTLELHGVARPYRVPTALRREGARVVAEGAFEVSIEAHGMRRPSLFGVVVDDAVRVEFHVEAGLEPPP